MRDDELLARSVSQYRRVAGDLACDADVMLRGLDTAWFTQRK